MKARNPGTGDLYSLLERISLKEFKEKATCGESSGSSMTVQTTDHRCTSQADA